MESSPLKWKFTLLLSMIPPVHPHKSIAWSKRLSKQRSLGFFFRYWRPFEPSGLPGPVPGAQAPQRSKLPSPYERDSSLGAQGQLASELNVCTTVPSACGAGWSGVGRASGEALRLSVGLICKRNATILPAETCSVESQTWRKGFCFYFFTFMK